MGPIVEKYGILSLDGGGVRGIMSTVFLRELEALTTRPLVEIFKLQIASSTGSLIQAGANHPGKKLSYKDLTNLYLDKSKEIFYRSLWDELTNFEGIRKPEYSTEGINKVLKEEFGDTTLGQFKSKNLYFTTFNTANRKMVVLNGKDHFEMKISQVIRDATAAPTYFKPNGSYIDGGTGANNPAGIGHGIARSQGIKDKNIVLLSVGTGQVDKPIDISDSGTLGVAEKMTSIFMSATMSSTDMNMNNILGENYHRVQFKIKEDQDQMANTSKENLEGLVKTAEEQIEENRSDLKKLAAKLNKM